MRSKKMIALLLLTTLTFSVVGCEDTNTTESKTTITENKSTASKETSETKDSTTIVEDESTTAETTSVQETETTTEEVTTATESFKEYPYDVNIYWQYEFITEYKDFLPTILNGKEFKTGDIIDVKAEIEKAGHSLDEYAQIYAFAYTTFIQMRGGGINVEVLEFEFDDISMLHKLDNEHNIVFKILTDCKVETRFEGDVYTLKIYSEHLR